MAPWVIDRISLIAVAITFAAPAVHAGRTDRAQEPLSTFREAIARYEDLVRSVEGRMPALEISQDGRDIHHAVAMRASAIRRARRDARMGDLFTAEVSELLRRRIRVAVHVHGDTVANVRREMSLATRGSERPVVNGRFAWATAAATLPCVLAALPELPERLQYRFVSSDLALVDVDANLVVDVLPEALGVDAEDGSS